MASYVILIYEEEKELTEAEFNDLMGRHNAFPEQAEALGGKVVSGKALKSADTATAVRGDVVTDGPFFETKEVLGGFYVIEAPDLDTAIRIAKVCPAPGGGVEVRPVHVFEE
jgi:hypothetical protein